MADPSMDDMFAGMKKKKKSSSTKKALLDELDAATAAAPVADEKIDTSLPVEQPDVAAAVPNDGDLDFSDLKKKKKKKTVRIAGSDEEIEDGVTPSQQSMTKTTVDKLGNETTETIAPADAEQKHDDTAMMGDEFADLKKKKKKGGKKAAFDLEAFEKELAAAESSEANNALSPPEGGSQVTSKNATPAGSDDEREEGEDPFSAGGEDAALSKAEAAAKAKAWLNEDRDYHYIEVSSLPRVYDATTDHVATAPRSILRLAVRFAPWTSAWRKSEEVHARASSNASRRQQAIDLCQHWRHLQKDAPSARARNPVPVRRTGHNWLRRRQRSTRHQGSLPTKSVLFASCALSCD